jgi:hypothetical protein
MHYLSTFQIRKLKISEYEIKLRPDNDSIESYTQTETVK